jgi:hypothetical protein
VVVTEEEHGSVPQPIVGTSTKRVTREHESLELLRSAGTQTGAKEDDPAEAGTRQDYILWVPVGIGGYGSRG